MNKGSFGAPLVVTRDDWDDGRAGTANVTFLQGKEKKMENRG